MNVLNAIGNVGKDADIRYTAGDRPQAIAQFSFAITSGWGKNQVTTWINCNVWGDRAKTLAPMLTKGTRIGITGELTNRPYTDKQGVEKYSLELRVSDVTLLGNKDASTSSAQRQDNKPNEKVTFMDGMNEEAFDQDIPF